MDQEEFVNAVKIAVLESSKKAMESILTKPPGRQPDQNILQLSAWYNNLSYHDKKMVDAAIHEAVETSVFGFLCVLDGVRAIENDKKKGRLLLYFEKNGERVLLNDFDDDFLHDIFKAKV